jgi:hypothetical protein
LEAEPKGDVWHSTLPDIVLTAEAESVTETETEESPPAEDPITPITSPDDSIPVTPVTPVTPPVVDDGGEEAPAFVVQIDPEKDIKIDGDADAVTVTVSVPEGALKDGIAEAVAVAEAAGSREPTLEIRFDTPATGGSTAEPVTVKEVTVKIPISDLQAVKESPVENVKVVSGAGEVALDSGAIGELIEELLARAETEGESATTVDLVIVQTEEKLEQKADLTPEQKDALHDENALGDRKVCEVFDVSFYAGVKRIEDFKTSKGKLTIGLPYTLQNGETAEGVGVLHVQKDGNTVPMVDGRKYDEKKGLIVFQTDHLSVYAVVYEEKAKPENTGGEDAKRGESGGCDAGFASAAGAFVFLLGIALAIRRTTD